MKKWFLLPAAAAMLMVLSSCATADSEGRIRYERTLSQLDLGGDYLCYSNTRECNRLTSRFFDLTFDVFAPELERIQFDPRAAAEVLNLGAIKAQGLSSYQLDSGVWQLKWFLYTGQREVPGLLSIVPTDNQQFPEINALPESTILATSDNTRCRSFLKLFTEICKTQPNPALNELPQTIDRILQAQLQNSLDEIVAALDGDTKLIITGPLSSPGYLLVIPDNGSRVANIIRTRCGLAPDAAQISWPGPMPVAWLPAPKLRLGNEQLVIYGGAILDEIELARKNGGLLETPEFSALTAGLSLEGTRYTVLNLPLPEICRLISEKTTNAKVLQRFVNIGTGFKPFRMFMLMRQEDDGILTIARSEYSLPSLGETYSLISGPLMVSTTALQALEKRHLPTAAGGNDETGAETPAQSGQNAE